MFQIMNFVCFICISFLVLEIMVFICKDVVKISNSVSKPKRNINTGTENLKLEREYYMERTAE